MDLIKLNLEISKYDCPITPGMRRCKVFIDNVDPIGLNWKNRFKDIEEHPDGSYIMINTGECFIMILKTGYEDILQAKNDDVIDKYVNIINEVISDGISQ